MQSPRLPNRTKWSYGIGEMGVVAPVSVAAFFLLFFFTEVVGLSPGQAGSILLLGRLWDAINDPLIGILSDATPNRPRWGRRYPWLIGAAIPLGLVCALQWWVPPLSSGGHFAYYSIISIIAFALYTAIQIPFTALAAELTQGYNQRTQLMSFKSAFNILGSIVGLIIAQVIFGLVEQPKEQYGLLGIVLGGLIMGGLAIAIFGTQPHYEKLQRHLVKADPPSPLEKGEQVDGERRSLGALPQTSPFPRGTEGDRPLPELDPPSPLGKGGQVDGEHHSLEALPQTSPFPRGTEGDRPLLEPDPPSPLGKGEQVDGEHHSLRALSQTSPFPRGTEGDRLLHSLLRNVPFRWLIGLYLCSWVGIQTTAAVLPYFVTGWMKLPEQHFIQMALTVQLASIFAIPLWSQLAQRTSKQRIYLLGAPLAILGLLGLFAVQPGQVPLMYGSGGLLGLGLSTFYLVPFAMLPDVIDLDAVENPAGPRREGLFTSVMVFLQKTALAIALFLVTALLDHSGWVTANAGADAIAQPESALFAIRCLMGPLPALTIVGGMVCAWLYPLTRKQHDQIVRRLTEHHSNAD